MRDQFEKLPSIRLFLGSFVFNDDSGEYIRSGTYHQPEYTLGFMNGAWYSFQEQQNQLDLINQYTAAQGASIKILNDERIKQQKKIDALEKEVEIRKQGASIMSWHREQILDMCESALRCSESIELNSVIGEIKELLK